MEANDRKERLLDKVIANMMNTRNPECYQPAKIGTAQHIQMKELFKHLRKANSEYCESGKREYHLYKEEGMQEGGILDMLLSACYIREGDGKVRIRTNEHGRFLVYMGNLFPLLEELEEIPKQHYRCYSSRLD